MLISELITEIIDEVGGDNTDTDLIGKMLGFIKGALRRVSLFCRGRLLIDTSYATLAAGANYITTPTGFIREANDRSVYYIESGKRQYIDKLTTAQFGAQVNTTATGKPAYYHIVENVIEFDKNAASDIVIYVEHFQEVDSITAATTFFGSSDMTEVVKDGAKYTYYSEYVEDPAKGGEKLNLFKVGLDELESKFMMSEQGDHIGD